MKKCKGCQKEIDPKAIKCPYCQTDQRNWFEQHKIFSVFLTLVFLIIVFAVMGSKGSHTSQPSVPAASDKPVTQTTEAAKQSAPTTAPQTLLDLSGSGTKTTQKFTAGGDWDLNWTYNCSNFGGQGNFQVMIYDGSGSLSFQNAMVNQLGKSDTGVEHYHNAGTYYFVVNSECKWSVKVQG